MKVLLASISLLLVSTMWVYGQPGNPGTQPVPITGLEYLLIGGGAYGASRLLKKKNKSVDKD
jgi:hypothetical protein